MKESAHCLKIVYLYSVAYIMSSATVGLLAYFYGTGGARYVTAVGGLLTVEGQMTIEAVDGAWFTRPNPLLPHKPLAGADTAGYASRNTPLPRSVCAATTGSWVVATFQASVNASRLLAPTSPATAAEVAAEPTSG